MMVAVSGMIIVQASDSSEAAAGSAGEMNVYVYDSSWTVQKVSAYNAAEAIMATSQWSSHPGTINTQYDYSYTWEKETYYNIDSTYGTITTFNQLSNNSDAGTTWNMLVFTKASSATTYSWSLGDTATGWYKPFADYQTLMPGYATANIALYYGSSSASASYIDSLTTFINNDTNSNSTISLTSISKAQGSVFEHTFYLKTNNNTSLTIAANTTVTLSDYSTATLNQANLIIGITVVGYGSDAVLALIDAIGSSNVSFQSTTSPVPGYQTYGWMNTMFGVGTSYNSSTDTYTYWQSYTSYTTLGDSSNVSAALGTGAYSALTNAPEVDGSLAFLYQGYQS